MSEETKKDNTPEIPVDDTGFFSQEDQRILKDNMDRREQMLEHIFKDGAPERSGDMRVAKEIIESMDSKIIEVAKIKAKAKEEDNKDRHVDLIVETLKRTQQAKEASKVEYIDVDIDDTHIPDDVVPGEMSVEYIELDINDFTNNEKEDGDA